MYQLEPKKGITMVQENAEDQFTTPAIEMGGMRLELEPVPNTEIGLTYKLTISPPKNHTPELAMVDLLNKGGEILGGTLSLSNDSPIRGSQHTVKLKTQEAPTGWRIIHFLLYIAENVSLTELRATATAGMAV